MIPDGTGTNAMARLPSDRWPDEGFSHRYITVAKLMELLAHLPPGAHLMVNQIGNLSVIRQYDSDTPEYLGAVNVGDETFEPVS